MMPAAKRASYFFSAPSIALPLLPPRQRPHPRISRQGYAFGM